MDKLQIFSLKPYSTKLGNGNTVYIRRISAAERAAWFEYVSSEELKAEPFYEAKRLPARLLAVTLCDESGKRLFADDEQDEVEAIDSVTFDELSRMATDLNGLGSSSARDAEKKYATTGSTTTS